MHYLSKLAGYVLIMMAVFVAVMPVHAQEDSSVFFEERIRLISQKRSSTILAMNSVTAYIEIFRLQRCPEVLVLFCFRGVL